MHKQIIQESTLVYLIMSIGLKESLEVIKLFLPLLLVLLWLLKKSTKNSNTSVLILVEHRTVMPNYIFFTITLL